MENLTIRTLLECLDEELLRQGYSKSTMYFYRRIWKEIMGYFDSKGISEYSEGLLLQYLDDTYDISQKKELNQLSQYDIQVVRVICMIGDYRLKGTFLRRYYGEPVLKSTEYLMIISAFSDWCGNRGNKQVTCKGKSYMASKFLAFLWDNGVKNIEKVQVENINKYVSTLSRYAKETISRYLSCVKEFFVFLYEEKYIELDFSHAVPHVMCFRHAKIPPVWSPDEVTKMLNAVDRGNPSGKRDYAILMLVTRLGIRVGDVKKLKFENFKWNTNRLEFTQSKTGEFLSLPLLKDVGWAVIDYIQNGRPLADTQCVFIRHCAPIGEFVQSNALYHLIDKHRKLAGLPPVGHKTGMHSLRHTLASVLLQKEVSLDVIADILGHQSVDSTSVYLKTDIDALRKCALVPMEVVYCE